MQDFKEFNFFHLRFNEPHSKVYLFQLIVLLHRNFISDSNVLLQFSTFLQPELVIFKKIERLEIWVKISLRI